MKILINKAGVISMNQMEQFLKKIEHASDQFSDKLSTYENIISISHDDADGICSSLIIQNMASG